MKITTKAFEEYLDFDKHPVFSRIFWAIVTVFILFWGYVFGALCDIDDCQQDGGGCDYSHRWIFLGIAVVLVFGIIIGSMMPKEPTSSASV